MKFAIFQSLNFFTIQRNQIELKESKEILRRIENRNLYKYVSETIIADDTLMIDLKNNEFFDQMKLEILQELEKHKMTINDPKMTNIYNKLNTNEIFISKNVFDYGDEDKNPIEKVQFYSKNEMKKSFKIKSNQVITNFIYEYFRHRCYYFS